MRIIFVMYCSCGNAWTPTAVACFFSVGVGCIIVWRRVEVEEWGVKWMHILQGFLNLLDAMCAAGLNSQVKEPRQTERLF
jgi:hypothetical protein